MSNRDDWEKAAAALDAIEAERAKLLEPTNDAFWAAEERLAELEEAIGAGHCIGRCPSCEAPVFENDPSYPNVDEDPFCAACAPTWADLLTSDSFVDMETEEPLTTEARRALYDAHVAAGGKPTDSMAR